MNTETGNSLEFALAFIADSIADSICAYANISGGYYQTAYGHAIADALYNAYNAIPYNCNDDYSAFINVVLDNAKATFIDKIEFDIDSYNYN